MSESEMSWHTVEWQPKIDGTRKDIPVECLVSTGALDSEADPVYLFGGYTEEKLALTAAISTLESYGRPAIGVNLPDSITTDESMLERVAIEVPVRTAEWFNERAGKPADQRVNVIGHSKGGAVLLLAGVEAPERYGAIGLISPVGITHEDLGGTELERIANYFRRLIVSNNREADHNPLVDPSNWKAIYEFMSRLSSDMIHGTLMPKLRYAFNLSLSENATNLAKDHPLRIFLGRDDKLYTVSEYRRALDEEIFRNNTQIIQGSHSALVSAMGRHQLRQASDWVESVRAAA